MSAEYILTLYCPDRPGILAGVSTELTRSGGDIRDAQSFGDDQTGEFFIRMHLLLPSEEHADDFRTRMAELAADQGLRWEFNSCGNRPRILILVSKFDHCLVDLLHRVRTGALAVDVPLVISNHDTTRELVTWHGVNFLHLPVSKENRAEQEQAILSRFQELDIDLVVLARYMQILTPTLVKAFAGRCINIHHSFLPSFKGALPYKQAHRRGVKLIGATAHYVTEDLDSGPIIAQGVSPVSHRDSVPDLIQIGSDLEKTVLAKAVRLHLDDRVLSYGNRTVIFD